MTSRLLILLLLTCSACTEGAFYSPGETSSLEDMARAEDQGSLGNSMDSGNVSGDGDASMEPVDMRVDDMVESVDAGFVEDMSSTDLGAIDAGPDDMGAIDMGVDDMGAPVDMNQTIDMNPPSELCATQIPGLTRRDMLGRPPGPYYSTYADLYGPFGGASGQRYIYLGEDSFISFPLRTPPASQGEEVSGLSWDIVPGYPDAVRVSISKCASAPLLSNALSPDCYVQRSGSSGGLTMVSNSNSMLRGLCRLDPDTDYFFNVAFIDAMGNGGCMGSPDTDKDICQWLTFTN